MSSDTLDSKETIVRRFIVDEFLSPEDEHLLSNDTRLISGGILDSIGTTRLVSYLEEQFNIRFEPQDVTVSKLDTISSIVAVLEHKCGQGT